MRKGIDRRDTRVHEDKIGVWMSCCGIYGPKNNSGFGSTSCPLRTTSQLYYCNTIATGTKVMSTFPCENECLVGYKMGDMKFSNLIP